MLQGIIATIEKMREAAPKCPSHDNLKVTHYFSQATLRRLENSLLQDLREIAEEGLYQIEVPLPPFDEVLPVPGGKKKLFRCRIVRLEAQEAREEANKLFQTITQAEITEEATKEAQKTLEEIEKLLQNQ